MIKKICICSLLLMIVSMACSFTLPFSTYEIGKAEIKSFSEDTPTDITQKDVIIEMSAGKLDITGGSLNLIEGNIEFNVPELEPDVISKDDYFAIIQDIDFNNGRIPVGKLKNKWDIQLGSFPMNLIISAGAYDGNIDFSDVSILNLDISDGASNADISFNLPNPVSMETFTYSTGASNINLYGLSNANFDEFTFKGGAGSYTLDFSGNLQKDSHVSVSSGVSNIKIIIPEKTNCEINLVGGINNVSLKGTWTIDDRTYKTPNEGNKLSIDVDMAVGSLELISN